MPCQPRAAEGSGQSCRFGFGHSGRPISTWQEGRTRGTLEDQTDVAEIDVLGSLGTVGSRSVHLLSCPTPGGTQAPSTGALAAGTAPLLSRKDCCVEVACHGRAPLGFRHGSERPQKLLSACFLLVLLGSQLPLARKHSSINAQLNNMVSCGGSAEGALKAAFATWLLVFWERTFTFSSSP